MIVELDHPPLSGRFVLKLYDRRFATKLRRDEKAAPWCPQTEFRYREFVRDGRASEFFDLCTANFRGDKYWADEQRETWDEAQLEAYLQHLCCRTYGTEQDAYGKLHDIQGKHIPRLSARPSLQASSDAGSANEHLDCPALLLEYIQGFPLTALAANAPEREWQSVCEDAIRVVHLIGDRGICNKDVKTRSFIVREDPVTKTFNVVMIDFGLCLFRARAESEREFNGWQADRDEEGAVGRVMQRMLNGGFRYRLSSRAEWLLDEFKSEE